MKWFYHDVVNRNLKVVLCVYMEECFEGKNVVGHEYTHEMIFFSPPRHIVGNREPERCNNVQRSSEKMESWKVVMNKCLGDTLGLD